MKGLQWAALLLVGFVAVAAAQGQTTTTVGPDDKIFEDTAGTSSKKGKKGSNDANPVGPDEIGSKTKKGKNGDAGVVGPDATEGSAKKGKKGKNGSDTMISEGSIAQHSGMIAGITAGCVVAVGAAVFTARKKKAGYNLISPSENDADI